MPEEPIALAPRPERKFEVGWKVSAFHGKVRRARRAMGLTQIQLAKYLGVSLPTVQNVENMTRMPSDELRDQMADFLHLSKEEVWPDWMEELSAPLSAVAYQECTQTEFSALSDRQKKNVKLLESGPSEDPEKQRLLSEASEGIEVALKSLTYREREIIKMRYGLDGGEVYTLLECARIWKVTAARVRQIEMKALMKLKQPERAGLFKSSAENMGMYFCQCGEAIGIAHFCHSCRKQGCNKCMRRRSTDGKYVWFCLRCVPLKVEQAEANSEECP